MGFNTNSNENCSNPEEKTICDQLADCEIQSLGNVDTAGLSDGDILCYHLDSNTFINISKEDMFGQFDLDIDAGYYSEYAITLTDSDSPDIVIDMSGITQDLCGDSSFISCMALALADQVTVTTDDTITGNGTTVPLSVDLCAAIDNLPYLGSLVCA